MTTFLPLLLIGLLFIGGVLTLRYYNHKVMTERVCSRNPDSEYCRKHYRNKMDKSEDQYKHCDVVFGETPSGGVKTMICYVDNNNRMVKKKEANKILVRELDEKGQPVFETWTTMQEMEQSRNP